VPRTACGSPAALDDPEPVHDRPLGAEHPEERLEEGEVDHLARSAGITVVKGHQDHHRARERRHAVSERQWRKRRRSVGLAGDRREAPHRLRERAEPGPSAVRPRLPIPRRPEQDQIRVTVRQTVVAKLPALERPRPEALDHDIGGGSKPAEGGLSVGCAEIECGGALVPPDDLPPHGLAVLLPAEMAEGIAAGMLDLDHVRAEVAEQGG
jgi:hypothetical protein